MGQAAEDSSFCAADLALWRPWSHDGNDLESLLVRALRKSHEDAALLSVLPVFVVNAADSLNWEATCAGARRAGCGAELGLILEIAARLSGRTELLACAESLRPERPTLYPYFPIRSPYEQKLVEARTPELARHWGFLMNVSEASFKSAYEKHRA